MNNYGDSIKYYELALNSAGTAQKKFDIYMESNEAKANIFKSTMDKLWLNTFNSEQFGRIIEFGTGFVQFVDGIGLANIAIITLSATIIIFSNNIAKSLVAVQNFIKGIATMNWSLAAINPIVAGLALAIGGLIVAINSYEQYQRKMYENTIKNANALYSEKVETDKLMKSISDLVDKEKLSVDEKTRMGIVQAELQKMYPDIFENLDIETMKYEDLAKAVDKVSLAKRNEVIADIEAQKKKLQAEIKSVEAETFSSGFAGITTPAKEKAIEERIKGLKQKFYELNALASDVMFAGSSSDEIEKNRLRSGDKPTKKPPPPPSPKGEKDYEKAYQSQYNIIRDLNFELDRQNELLSQAEDLDKIPILSERNKLLEQQKKNLHDINEARRVEFSRLSPTSERYGELIEKIQDTSLEWWKLNSAQKENLKNIGEINKKAQEALDKQNEEARKNLEDVQKQMADIIKKRYEIEKDEAEKAHKDKLEQLDDELNAYKDNINEEIKEIDKLRDAEDFDKSQQKTTDKISELQNEKNTLSMAAQSGDLTAIERIKEIDKELAEERERLAELQSDREHELRKENLQDALDSKEKEIKSAKEAEEEKYETIKENYDKLLQEGNLYAEANKALTTGMVEDINGKMVTVAEAFKAFSDTFGQTLGTLGSNIQTEFIDKLNQAQMLINSMSGLDANKGISNTSNVGAINTSALSNSGLLSGANITSILGSLSKINLSSMMPSITMPKLSGVGSGGMGNLSIGNITIQTQSVDSNHIGDITKQVMYDIKREYQKLGGGWKP
jgi:hypothetical protein